jgi:hypothetical protein
VVEEREEGEVQGKWSGKRKREEGHMSALGLCRCSRLVEKGSDTVFTLCSREGHN